MAQSRLGDEAEVGLLVVGSSVLTAGQRLAVMPYPLLQEASETVETGHPRIRALTGRSTRVVRAIGACNRRFFDHTERECWVSECKSLTSRFHHHPFSECASRATSRISQCSLSASSAEVAFAPMTGLEPVTIELTARRSTN